MERSNQKRRTFPASVPERASIRALKNWLFTAPGESPFEDQVTRLRIAAAIAAISSSAISKRSAQS